MIQMDKSTTWEGIYHRSQDKGVIVKSEKSMYYVLQDGIRPRFTSAQVYSSDSYRFYISS